MTRSQIFKASALLSASLAALSISACNKAGDANGAAPNGAYVQDASVSTPDTTTSSTTSSSLPPRSEYQRVSNTAPPPLPQYDQPPIPGPGYEWAPGYWDWSDGDYYWVPGSWVEPPRAGLYWTPGYWRFYNGSYLFSDGYWGPDVGFYGGVNYGYGYGGDGYYGGRWQNNQFYYNSAANNFGDRRMDAVYTQSAPSGGGRASYNGGADGVRVAPTPTQVQAATARHFAPTHTQVAAVSAARAEPQLRAGVNRGAPPIAATVRPGAFHDASGVTAARSAANYTPQPRSAGGAPAGGSGQSMTAAGSPRRDIAPSGAVAPYAATRPGSMASPRAGMGPDRSAAPAAPYHAATVRADHAPLAQAQVDRTPMQRAPMQRAPVERAAPSHFAAAPVRTAPQMRSAPAPMRTMSAPRAAPPAAARAAPAAAQGGERKPNHP